MGERSGPGVPGRGVGPAAYKTPRWVQVWFLRRSRDNWKRKYMALKAESKRLRNRVNDVTKSRERWRALAEGAREGAGGAGGGGGPDAAPGGAALKKGGAGGGASRGGGPRGRGG